MSGFIVGIALWDITFTYFIQENIFNGWRIMFLPRHSRICNNVIDRLSYFIKNVVSRISGTAVCF